MDEQTVSMNKFYEFDAERPYEERMLAHSRLDIVIKEVTKFVEKMPNKTRLLDIGITDGYILEQVYKRKVESYGLDIAFQTLKRMKIHFHSKEEFVSHLTQGSITAIPFQTGSFDVVTACEILEHMTDQDLPSALRELHRILKPGGRLFITTPYRENIKSSLIKCPKCGVVFPAWGHLQNFDEKRWKGLAKSYGLNLIKVKKIYGTDFRLARFKFGLPFIKLAARIFSVNSLTKLLVIISK